MTSTYDYIDDNDLGDDGFASAKSFVVPEPDRDSLLVDLKKARDQAGFSNAPGGWIGQRRHLIDYESADALVDSSPHHSRCLEAKASATVGLGHRERRVHDELDPMTEVSWQETLNAVAYDALLYGNGYIEVVRDEDGAIISLHHSSAKGMFACVEDDAHRYHYEVADGGQLMPGLSGLRWAQFGERDELIERLQVPEDRRRRVSEVIAFRVNRGRRSKYYGYPDWISAVPSIELSQCVVQGAFDFFFNGGVPASVIEVAGARMAPEDFDDLKNTLSQHQGVGRRQKLMLLNLYGEGLEMKFHRLAGEQGKPVADATLRDDAANSIVTAHGVPPLLAGIQTPGKLGASNEQVASIRAFQVNVIEPLQRLFSSILACTLGEDPTVPLSADDFRGEDRNGFNTNVEALGDLTALATAGQMRQDPQQAAAEGRDLADGLRQRGGGRGRGRDPNEPVDN